MIMRPLIMNWERDELAAHLGAEKLEGKSQAELAVMWREYLAAKEQPAISNDGQILDALGWDRKSKNKRKDDN